MSLTTIDRREFLQDLATGGLVLVITATGCRRFSDRYATQSSSGGAPGGPAVTATPFAPAVYLRIGTDGDATVIVHRSEMGQGIRTSLAMAVADDLEADWSRVHVEQAPGDEKTYGGQDTDGSHSIQGLPGAHARGGRHGPRDARATAAAQQWRVPLSEVRAQQHQVSTRPTGRTLDYAALVPSPASARPTARLPPP